MYANWWGLIGDRSGRDKYQAEVRAIKDDLAKSDSLLKALLGFNPNLSDRRRHHLPGPCPGRSGGFGRAGQCGRALHADRGIRGRVPHAPADARQGGYL
jgi:hypothetical protein